MPKINVYLPSDLAAAVRTAGFPVSPVCQQALADAVRAAARTQAIIDSLRDPGLDAGAAADVGRAAAERMTARLAGIIERAVAGHGPAGPAGPGELLLGLLDEDANLCVRILQAFDADLDELRATVERIRASQPPPGETAAAVHEPAGAASMPYGLTVSARSALAAAMEASVGLGHSYVGTEHLLLGLLADPQSVAGRALGEHHVKEADARRALTAALAGFTYGQRAQSQAPQDAHEELGRRLDAIESRLAALGA